MNTLNVKIRILIILSFNEHLLLVNTVSKNRTSFVLFSVHKPDIIFSAARGVNQWDLQLERANPGNWLGQQKLFKMECCS